MGKTYVVCNLVTRSIIVGDYGRFGEIVTLKMAAETFSKISKAAGKIKRRRNEEHLKITTFLAGESKS